MYKIEKQISLFDEKGVERKFFHKRKHLIDINKVDIDRIMLSNKDSCGKKGAFKYFIGYITSQCIKSLCIKLPQMNGCAKYFDSNNKYINFLIYDKEKNTMQFGIRLVLC